MVTYLQSDAGPTALSCPRMNSGTVPLCLLGQILWKDARGMLVFLSPTHRLFCHTQASGSSLHMQLPQLCP